MSDKPDQSDNQESGTNPNTNTLTTELNFQIAELNYQRTYRWNIFTWASSLLFGGGSGLVVANAFISDKTQNTHDNFLKGALAVIIFALTFISCIWLHYHFAEAENAENNIKKLVILLQKGDNTNEDNTNIAEYHGIEERTNKVLLLGIKYHSIVVLAVLGFCGIIIVLLSQL